MMRRPHSDEELEMKSLEVNQQEGDEGAAVRGENPSRTSKLPAGGVVLLVLVGLLAAALIVIYRLSFDKIRTNQTLQTLKEENEALRRNMSEETLKCEAGWEKHGGKFYYFSTSKSSWNDSRRSCIDQRSDLVKIDSREEQMFLIRRLRHLMERNEEFWIGLTDSVEEGKWFWVDGSPLDQSLTFWQDGEPNNYVKKGPAGEDCVRMEKKGNFEDLKSWDDHSCDVQLRRICAKPAEI